MAEKDEGQGSANPPLEKPNEGLPMSYNQLMGSNNPKKTSWPELVGTTSEEAKKKIKEEMGEADIQLIPPGYSVTFDFRSQRVRIYVDESDKVIRTPSIG
ncbi:subtilisin inhibitor CLSI-I [Arachis duranensis]|uniref:Subtilisin inhibitor CLSI-I n=1 Tax=Arachis duranensis TaxID=130453 RepID=A0A6P4B583_ARADU|nr:subtilisin inhibitor CLSI-I [Arachis duranensis]